MGLALKSEEAKRIPKKKAGVGGCFASEDHDVSIANLSMSRSMSKGSPKVSGWEVYCCDFLLLPIASCCSQCLLLVVRRSKHT